VSNSISALVSSRLSFFFLLFVLFSRGCGIEFLDDVGWETVGSSRAGTIFPKELREKWMEVDVERRGSGGSKLDDLLDRDMRMNLR
jgi:hypothetical protein